jgi:hypothetical protein
LPRQREPVPAVAPHVGGLSDDDRAVREAAAVLDEAVREEQAKLVLLHDPLVGAGGGGRVVGGPQPAARHELHVELVAPAGRVRGHAPP